MCKKLFYSCFFIYTCSCKSIIFFTQKIIELQLLAKTIDGRKDETLFIGIFLYLWILGCILKFQFPHTHISSFNIWWLDIFHYTSDHIEFFTPLNTLLKNGIYSVDGIHPDATRMPGYIFPYIIFRLFFNEFVSYFLVGVFQLLLKSLSCIILIKLLRYFKIKNFLIFIALIFYIFIPYYWEHDYKIHPNSVSVSVSILILYLLFCKPHSYVFNFVLGVLVVYLYFIRPFLIYYVASTGLMLVIITYKKEKEKMFKRLIVYGIPIIFIHSIWIVRNYYAFNEFIFLQTSYNPLNKQLHKKVRHYNYNYNSFNKFYLRKLFAASGLECYEYFSNSPTNWFIPPLYQFKQPLSSATYNRNPFPNYVFTSRLNYDSLVLLKQLFYASYNEKLNEKQQDSLSTLISNVIDRYILYYKEDKPLHYFVYSRFLRIKNFLFKNVTMDWLSTCKRDYFNRDFYLLPLKLISLTQYIIILFAFFVSLWYVRNMQYICFFILLNLFFLILEFITLIEATHFMYFVTSYANGIVLLTFLLNSMREKRKIIINNTFLYKMLTVFLIK